MAVIGPRAEWLLSAATVLRRASVVALQINSLSTRDRPVSAGQVERVPHTFCIRRSIIRPQRSTAGGLRWRRAIFQRWGNGEPGTPPSVAGPLGVEQSWPPAIMGYESQPGALRCKQWVTGRWSRSAGGVMVDTVILEEQAPLILPAGVAPDLHLMSVPPGQLRAVR